jgi:hypothetical protein
MPRRISCHPSDDTAFCDAATEALHRIDGQIGPEDVADVLADMLRARYPGVQVHRQEALARVFDDDLWYVYRDGKPGAGHQDGNRADRDLILRTAAEDNAARRMDGPTLQELRRRWRKAESRAEMFAAQTLLWMEAREEADAARRAYEQRLLTLSIEKWSDQPCREAADD